MVLIEEVVSYAGPSTKNATVIKKKQQPAQQLVE
jgi:hypothetical protein